MASVEFVPILDVETAENDCLRIRVAGGEKLLSYAYLDACSEWVLRYIALGWLPVFDGLR